MAIHLFTITGALPGWYVRERTMPSGKLLISIEHPESGQCLALKTTSDHHEAAMITDELLAVVASRIYVAGAPIERGERLELEAAREVEALRLFGMVSRGTLGAKAAVHLMKGILR